MVVAYEHVGSDASLNFFIVDLTPSSPFSSLNNPPASTPVLPAATVPGSLLWSICGPNIGRTFRLVFEPRNDMTSVDCLTLQNK